MSMFAFARRSFPEGQTRVGVAAVTRIRLHKASFVGGFLCGLIALASLDLGVRLLLAFSH